MKHKLLTMLLAIVAAFCLCLGLAACGGNGPDTGGSQTGQGGSAWEEMWDREREIAFEAPFAAKVPFGGEALAGNQDSPEKTMEILRSLQVSYLNSVHDVNCLERWKNMPAAAGETGAETLYDWIGAHLGYRLSIRETSWEKNRPERRDGLENISFGSGF